MYDLDSFLSELVSTVQYEQQAKFAQGDVLCKACTPDIMHALGFGTQDALLKYAAVETGRTLRTMWKRLEVSRVFAPDQRNARVSWEAHYLCTQTDDPPGWLAHAADQEMTTAQLKLAIKAAGGDPNKGDTTFVCRAADATVLMVSDNGRHVVLDMAGGIKVAQGTAVIVTMVIMGVVKAPAQVDTSALVVDIVRGEIVHAGEIAA